MLFDMSQTVLHVMNVIIRFILHDCTCLVGDGRLGYPNRGPYDAIHVGAAAKEMPQSVKKRNFSNYCQICWNEHYNSFLLIVDRSIGTWWTFNSTYGSRKFRSNFSADRQDSGRQNQAAISYKRGICSSHW